MAAGRRTKYSSRKSSKKSTKPAKRTFSLRKFVLLFVLLLSGIAVLAFAGAYIWGRVQRQWTIWTLQKDHKLQEIKVHEEQALLEHSAALFAALRAKEYTKFERLLEADISKTPEALLDHSTKKRQPPHIFHEIFEKDDFIAFHCLRNVKGVLKKDTAELVHYIVRSKSLKKKSDILFTFLKGLHLAGIDLELPSKKETFMINPSTANLTEPKYETLTDVTPLAHAISIGNHPAVEALLRLGVNTDYTAKGYKSLLSYAVAREASVEIIQTLISYGVSPFKYEKNGMTAFHLAITKSSSKHAQHLVEAILDAISYEKINPIEYKSALARFPSMNPSLTPLHLAVKHLADVYSCIAPLIHNGAELDAIDFEGRTPVQRAQEAKIQVIMKYFDKQIQIKKSA